VKPKVGRIAKVIDWGGTFSPGEFVRITSLRNDLSCTVESIPSGRVYQMSTVKLKVKKKYQNKG